MIVGLELGEPSGALQGLGLTELQDQRRGPSGLELPLPRTEVKVAPLFVDGVCLPGHGAEDRILGGEGRGDA